jgi:DegV family protein with EDD domain
MNQILTREKSPEHEDARLAQGGFNMLKIITDSCSDLDEEFLKQHNITVVPLHLRVDGECYTPGEDISYEEALTKIAEAKDMPHTSQPSPHAYQQAFEAASEEQILCLTLSSELSGSYNSATLASQDERERVTVHDTRQGAFGQGFQVMLAATMQEQGRTLAEIKQALTDYYKQTSIVVILEKYDNAIKGGRMNKYAGKIIEKLNIRGIIEVIDGKVIVVDKARGADKTFQKMVERISSKADDFSKMVIGIAHFQNLEMAEKYRDTLNKLLHPKKIYVGSIDPTLGVYCDKGGLVISISPDPYTFA